MRTSLVRLAKVSPRTVTPLPPELQILAPIPLYRRLLRAHRKYLPPAARAIGDDYVKAEFRRTKDTDNPVYIIGFLSRWQVHLIQFTPIDGRNIVNRLKESIGKSLKSTRN